MINSFLTITELQQKQEVRPSKCFAFFWHMKFKDKRFCFTHTSVIRHPHEYSQALKKGAQTVFFESLLSSSD